MSTTKSGLDYDALVFAIEDIVKLNERIHEKFPSFAIPMGMLNRKLQQARSKRNEVVAREECHEKAK